MEKRNLLREKIKGYKSWSQCLMCSMLVPCLSLGLSACSLSEDVNYVRYTLIQDVDPMVYQSSYIVEVQIAPLLDQGSVVLQVSDVSLRPAKNYRYSSQLSNELTLLFLNELHKSDLSTNYQFGLYVSKFQGTLDGKVLVEVLGQVVDSRNKRVIFSKSYNREDTQQSDGYEQLVLSLKENFIDISQEMIADFIAFRR